MGAVCGQVGQHGPNVAGGDPGRVQAPSWSVLQGWEQLVGCNPSTCSEPDLPPLFWVSTFKLFLHLTIGELLTAGHHMRLLKD
jgi:hypothetical protein